MSLHFLRSGVVSVGASSMRKSLTKHCPGDQSSTGVFWWYCTRVFRSYLVHFFNLFAGADKNVAHAQDISHRLSSELIGIVVFVCCSVARDLAARVLPCDTI